MSLPPPKVFSVFICTADEDRNLYEKLEKQLSPFNNRNGIVCRSNQQIWLGKKREEEIKAYLQEADLFLLLISSDFYTSQECLKTMQYALRRSAQESAIVIPILLRPFDWQSTEIGALQALPRNLRPVTGWANREKAFYSIAKEINIVIEALRRHVVIISSLSDQTFTQSLTHNLAADDIFLGEEKDFLELASLKDCIREASAVVVLASPETRHTHKLRNVRRLLDMYQRPIVDVLVSNAGRDSAKPPLQQSHEHEWISVNPRQETSAFEKIHASLNRVRYNALFFVSSSQEEAEAELLHEPRNPYKGLRAFTSDDAHDFFGREKTVQDLVKSLQDILAREQQGQPSFRLITIIGPSGSGKSSIAMAGLLPRLQQGVISGSQTWIYLDAFAPGAYPLEILALALAGYLPKRGAVSLQEDFKIDPERSLHILARQIAPQPGKKVVLFIDQFEELFTQTTSEEERRRFIELIVKAASEPGGPVVVILTLRADFYDRPMAYPALSLLMQERMVQILPMETQELRAVIEKPAMFPDVQLIFEGDLVGDLLYSMWGQVGALPLLQFTLEQLFQRRNGRFLTLESYKDIGGIKGALINQAEATYKALRSEEHRKLTRTLFLRLIHPGATEQDATRRRASFSEFLLSESLQTNLLRETISAFITARLLTSGKTGGTTTLEISHEALIREWPKLSYWLYEAREDIRLQHIISEDTTEWQQRGRPADRLYRGGQLIEAETWVSRNMPSQDEADFLQKSREQQAQQAQLERNQLVQEFNLRRQVARRQTFAAVSSLAFFCAVIIVFILFSNLRLQNALLVSNPASVTNTNDHGQGSLREAIALAQPGELITFAHSVLQGTIVLTGGEIQINKDLVINGPGASQLSISGNGKNRVLNIGGNAQVTLVNITIQDGYVTGSVEHGACIFNHAFSNLTLINSTITHCQAVESDGGGITNNGTLTLSSSLVSNNSATSNKQGKGGSGGGIDNYGTLTITKSTISQNKAYAGGGIHSLFGGSLTLQESTISDNDSTINGGGFFSSGSFLIEQSTISGNRALQEGGGIFALESAAAAQSNAIFYSTIYNNTAHAGGGLYVSAPLMNNPNFPSLDSASLSMTTSIIAGNSALGGLDVSGPLYVNGDNLIQSVDSSITLYFQPASLFDHQATDSIRIQYTRDHLILGKSPNLGPLSNNGGSTATHKLLPGSPAIDAISPGLTSFCASKPSIVAMDGGIFVNAGIDQRESQRPSGKGCDLGAFEA